MKTIVFSSCLLLGLCAALSGWHCRPDSPAVPRIASISADTSIVPALLDSARAVYRNCRMAKAAGWVERAALVFLQNGHAGRAYRTVDNFVFETERCDSLAFVQAFLDRFIIHTAGVPATDTLAGKFYNLKGYYFQREGRYSEANTCYELGLPKLPPERFARDWALVLNNISQNYNSLGDYKKGEEYALQGLQFLSRHSAGLSPQFSSGYRVKVLRSLGWSYYEQRRLNEALAVFYEAFAAAPESKKCDLLTFISKCYLDGGHIDSAFSAIRAGLRWSARLAENTVNVDAEHQLARCFFYAGNLPEAQRLFYRVLPAGEERYGKRHPDCAKTWVYLGQIAQRRHQPDSAVASFQRTLAYFFPDDPALREGLANPDAGNLFPDYWLLDALTGKAQALCALQTNQRDPAALEDALESITLATVVKEKLFAVFKTDTSKSVIAAGSVPLYETAIELALLAGDTVRAYRFAQTGKAALLRERMGETMALAQLPDSMKTTRQTLLQQIAAYEGALQRGEQVSGDILLALKMQLNRLEFRIDRLLATDSSRMRTLESWPAERIRAALPDNTALLDFFQGDSTLYGFAIGKNGCRAFRVTKLAALTRDITTLRDAVTDWGGRYDAEQPFIRASRTVYKALLEAPMVFLRDPDPDLDRLWIVPDGVLHYLPFDALLTGEATTWRGSRVPFLVRQYAVGYAYSAQQFFQLARPEADREVYAGWGIRYDPATLRTINARDTIPNAGATLRDYGPLPRARQEVEAAQRLLGGRVWLNEAAGRAQFVAESGRYRVCHLAMHAIAEEERPGHSRLVFTARPSDPQSDAHFLYTADIYALVLYADLVVLSACHTAHGQLLRGEGVASIGRAFQFAGARSVLMTQWQAEDNAAYALVPAFFERLRNGMPKDVALRQAKLALLDQPAYSAFQAPGYWAGFVVSGDMEAVELEPANRGKWIWIVLVVLGLAIGLWRLRVRFKEFSNKPAPTLINPKYDPFKYPPNAISK